MGEPDLIVPLDLFNDMTTLCLSTAVVITRDPTNLQVLAGITDGTQSCTLITNPSAAHIPTKPLSSVY